MKNTFKYATSYLKLARDAANRVYRMLQDDEAEEDYDLLGDVFSLPETPDEDGIKPAGKGKKKKIRKKPNIVIPKPLQKIRISRIEGGFTLNRAAPGSPTPARIRVRAAYDVRKGNAFKQWDPADFNFNKGPLKIKQIEGLDVKKCDGNRIILAVTNPDFSISVLGFDLTRGDLILDVKPEGNLDA